jgi:hypothetical protein
VDNQELPESVQEDILNAELTPDERMVAEEDAAEELQGDHLFTSENAPEAGAFDGPKVDPESNGQLVDDYTIRRAQQYNFSEEQIKGFSDQEHLTQTLNLMDKELLQQPSQPADPQQAPAAESVQPEVESILEYDDYMDPGIKKNFETLEQRNRDLLQFIEGHLKETEMSQFDDKCSGLGDSFHPLLGSSIEERRNPDSGAFANASNLWDNYLFLKGKSQGMTDDDVFRRAIAATFPDQQVQFAEQRVRHEVSDRIRDSQGRFTARPSKRGAVAQPPGEDQEAQDWIDTWTSERGINSAPAMSIDEMLDS